MIYDILNLIAPGAKWSAIGDSWENLVWEDNQIPKPTRAEFEQARQQVMQDYEACRYQQDRRFAYPQIGQQLDALWHDIDSGLLGEQAKTGQWYQAVKAVKNQFPKPE